MKSVSQRNVQNKLLTDTTTLDKVRLLYDANQPTARIIARSKKDLDTPLVGTLYCHVLQGPILFLHRT